MKAALILAGLLLLAGLHPAAAAYSVELNGIVNLFSHKMALLVLGRGEDNKPASFTLSEGESQFGIKLLAVDVAGQRVQIERHGKISYLRLSGAPNITADPAVETAVKPISQPVPGELSVEAYLASEEVRRVQAGNPIYKFTSAESSRKKNDANRSDDSNPGNGSKNSSSSAATTGAGDFTKELWYQDSLIMEQQRAATVADVLAGRKSPLPRTPLTPPGTPGQLLDRETIYSDHIPGFRVYGFVD